MKKFLTTTKMLITVWVFLMVIPLVAHSETIIPPVNFTTISEDDGLGGTKDYFVTSVSKGSAPISFDFNVSGGIGAEAWSISSMLCTDDMSFNLTAFASSINGSNGIFTFTPSEVHILEFTITVAVGSGVPVSKFVRINITRTPIDLILVLDKSGSMGTISSGSITRWNALVSAVELFMEKFEAFRVEGDRVAITYFHSVVENGFGSVTSPFIQITDPATVPSSKTQVHNSLMTNGPASMTAMGEALADAKNKHVLPPPTPAHTRIELLFTDGYQNWPNNDRLVGTAGTALNDGTPINDGTGPGSISIYTIGIGAAGSLPAVLSAIANKNRGIPMPPGVTISSGSSSWSTLTGNESSFVTDFSNAFKSILEQFSPQILGSQQGVLGKTTSLSDSLMVDCNKEAEQLLFEVYSPFAMPVSIEKNGVKIYPTYSHTGPGYQIFVYKFAGTNPAFKSEGKWKVKLSLTSKGGESLLTYIKRGLEYSIVAIADDHNLDYTCSPGAGFFKAGDAIKPALQLSYKGTALTDASVLAILLKPGQDLGNLLATTSVILDTTKGSDPGSPGNQKYNQLINDPSFLAKMLPKEQTLTLPHTSQGVYTISAGTLDTSGVYRLIFFINDTLTGGDIIQRREEQSIYVQFGDIDLPSSQPVLTGSGNQWVLTIRPKTKLQLFVGPAFQQAFGLTGKGILIKDVIDKGDGTYEIKFEGDPNAKIDLTLLGAPVYSGTLNNLSCYGPDASLWLTIKCWLIHLGLPGWLIWIIMLIVAILIWLIFRKKK